MKVRAVRNKPTYSHQILTNIEL